MKNKHNSENSWSWSKNVLDKSYQGMGLAKESKEFAKTTPHKEQVDNAIQNEQNQAKTTKIKVSTTNDVQTHTINDNELKTSNLSDYVELWNEGRKLVLTNYPVKWIAYKLNCYNDKAEKWIIKRNGQFVKMIKEFDKAVLFLENMLVLGY